MTPRLRNLRIRTPEGVSFSMHLAGPVTRFLAWVIDFAIIIALSSVLSSTMVLLTAISMDFSRAAGIIAYFVISIGYGILLEWKLKGQTLGKRLLKIRVMDERGLNLQLSQIVLRNLLRFIDSFPMLYAVGGIASLVSAKAQRLGDYAANTIVVHTSINRVVLPAMTKPVKYNSLSEYPHLEARLRQLTEPSEIYLAVQALVRRKEFKPEARIVLYRELKEHFLAKVHFPSDLVDSMSDEAFVNNVVDTIFRTSGSSKV
ncbi:RDD family protein [bacterium]|nr:RDD family protein [bacterium]